jgi:hypothetical protein
MMNKKILSVIMSAIVLSGCEGGGGGADSAGLRVSAGPDTTMYSGQSIVINGTAIDTSANIASMSWSPAGGASGLTISNQNCDIHTSNGGSGGYLVNNQWGCSLTVTAPQVSVPTVYQIALTASEATSTTTTTSVKNSPKSATSTMNLTVYPQQVSPMTINLGNDFSVLGGNAINLTCNTNGGLNTTTNPMTYYWEVSTTSTDKITILNPTQKNLTITAPQPAENPDVYMFTCTATDGQNTVKSASVNVTVNHNSIPATANAGVTTKIGSNLIALLDGSGSTLSGTTTGSSGTTGNLYYQWGQIDSSGYTVSLTNANTSKATFLTPTVNTDTVLTFQLSVKDSPITLNTTFLPQEQQTVDVIVSPYIVVSDAGPAQAIIVDSNNGQTAISVSLDGSRTNIPANNQIYYNWVQLNGPKTVVLNNSQTVAPSFSIETPSNDTSWVGTYTFQLSSSNTLNPSSYAASEISTTTVTLTKKN